jgi:hypothetical protein
MKTWIGGALVATLWLPAMTSAHHSPAMFDLQQRVTLSGTVLNFQWTNPHCYVQLLVENKRGQEVEWSLEASAPNLPSTAPVAAIDAQDWRPHYGGYRAASEATQEQWRVANRSHCRTGAVYGFLRGAYRRGWLRQCR